MDEANTGWKGGRVPCRAVKSWVSRQQCFLQHPCVVRGEAGHSPPSAGQVPRWPLGKGWTTAPQTFPGKLQPFWGSWAWGQHHKWPRRCWLWRMQCGQLGVV